MKFFKIILLTVFSSYCLAGDRITFSTWNSEGLMVEDDFTFYIRSDRKTVNNSLKPTPTDFLNERFKYSEIHYDDLSTMFGINMEGGDSQSLRISLGRDLSIPESVRYSTLTQTVRNVSKCMSAIYLNLAVSLSINARNGRVDCVYK